jgi:hypothetical protein
MLPTERMLPTELISVSHDRAWLESIHVLYAGPVVIDSEASPEVSHEGGEWEAAEAEREKERERMQVGVRGAVWEGVHPSSSWTVGGHQVQLSCVAVLERDCVRRLVLDRFRPGVPMYVHSEARIRVRGGFAVCRDSPAAESVVDVEGEVEGGVEVDTCDVMAWYARVMLSMLPFLSHPPQQQHACQPRALESEGGKDAREEEGGGGKVAEEAGIGGVNILVLGLGGGIIPTYLINHLPEAHIYVVELLHELVPVASRYFGLPIHSPRLHIHIGDAFDYLQCPPPTAPRQYDSIMVDLDTENHVGPGLQFSHTYFFEQVCLVITPSTSS